MPAAVKSSAPTGQEARMPGGGAFALPDVPDMMSGWMMLASGNAQAWQSEWTNFVARRMEQDRLAIQRFTRCRNLLEAAKVQQDWYSEAVASYLEEGRRFAAIAAEPTMAAQKSMRVVQVN